MVALGCNSPTCADGGDRRDVSDDYRRLGTAPGYCHHCQTGLCPVGITTQDLELENRLAPNEGARRLRKSLGVMNMELTTLARACGKSDVHHLEREDLAALTIEAAAIAKVKLTGTNWIPGLDNPRLV
jgi:methylamine---glutamate N-methyltransferase subunit C